VTTETKRRGRMKILVGYDGSEASKAALAYALKRAKTFQGEVHVVRSFAEGMTVNRQMLDERDEASKKLEEIKDSISKEQIKCVTGILINGITHGENILEYATENGIDEIFMGSKKTSKVGKLVFGSTAQYVILQAPCPVTTVKATKGGRAD
jgi:nucleotide-binding universal stress UspA family protein